MKSDARYSLASTTGEMAARQATLGDVELLIDLCQRGFPDTLTWGGPRFLSRNWWRSALRSLSAETWLFSIDGKPSGLCVLVQDINGWWAKPLYAERSWTFRLFAAALCPKLILSRLVKKILAPRPLPSECPRSEAIATATGSRTRVRLLAVAPDKRRQGFGKRILQFCENRTMELGREIIELFVSIENASARHFYAQQGYVCTRHKRDGCVFTKVLGISQLFPARPKAESGY